MVNEALPDRSFVNGIVRLPQRTELLGSFLVSSDLPQDLDSRKKGECGQHTEKQRDENGMARHAHDPARCACSVS